MKRPLRKQRMFRAMAWLAVVLVGGALGVAQAAAQTSGQRSDGQIEMDVVKALNGADALKNDLITAATVNGEVTLTGTVSSEQSRQLAETLTMNVEGVRAVHDHLKVGNPADAGLDNSAGAANDPGAEDTGPYDGTPQAGEGPAPPNGQAGQQDDGQYAQGGYGQGSQGDYGQAGPPPQYGQQAPPQYGQPQPQYGEHAPPPPNGGLGPAPSYGQGSSPNYGQGPAPAYGQERPQYGYGQRRPYYRASSGPVTVPAGTLLRLRTSEPVGSKRASEGTPVEFTVIRDVVYGGVLAIPRGATVHGVVTEVRKAQSGTLTGSTVLALRLVSMDMGGRTYPLRSDLFKVRGPGKGGRTASSAIGGALIGAIIGGAAGGGSGAAIGAVAGGGVGTAASAAARSADVWIPAEALVTFHLMAPVTVHPVSQQEADRMAQGLYRGGPTLRRRGNYGYNGAYGRPYRYRGPRPYWYGPVYYRPYYFSGGFYYWR